VPELGRLRLDGLTPAHLAAGYDRLLGRGLSPKSVLNTHRLLHRALSDAVRWGMLVRNPCDLVDPPRAQRPAVRALDAEEVSRLLAACAGDDPGPLVTVAMLTGLRLGELLGLTWDDIDLERGELRVVRAVHRVRGRGLVAVPPKPRHRSGWCRCHRRRWRRSGSSGGGRRKPGSRPARPGQTVTGCSPRP